jgi:alpha-glucoside transport system permease protein
MSSGWWNVFLDPANPQNYTIQNYTNVLFGNNIWRSFLNSFIISIPATLISLFFAALAGYAFAWLKFPGRNVLFLTIVGLIVVPLQMTFIPIIKIYSSTGLYGSYVGIWLAHAGYGMPLMIYMMRNFMGGLPKELFESAFIDGASVWTAFTRLVIPLSLPVLASLAIFQFLWIWNDLIVSLIYMPDPSKAPITLKIANLVGSQGQSWHLLLPSAFISMIIPLIVFFSLQKYFVRGLTAGAVKG